MEMTVSIDDARLLMEMGSISKEEFQTFVDKKAEAVKEVVYADNRIADYSDLLAENARYAEPDIKMI